MTAYIPYCDLIVPQDLDTDNPVIMIYPPPEAITCARKKVFDLPRRITSVFIRSFLVGHGKEWRFVFGNIVIDIPERLIDVELASLQKRKEEQYYKLVKWKINTAKVLFDGNGEDSIKIYKTLSPDISISPRERDDIVKLAKKNNLDLVFIDREPGEIFLIFNTLLANIILSDTENGYKWQQLLRQEYKKRMLNDAN